MYSKRLIVFFYLLFRSISLFATNVKTDIAVESSPEAFDRPLSGMITITHSSTAKIDLESFTLNQHPLSVELVKRVIISPGNEGTAVSIYRFDVPAKKPGIYILNPIFFDVDGKIYHSDEIKYEQQEPKIVSVAKIDQLFQLEAAIEKPPYFYQGQRARFIYRVYFNQNVELTASQFPLLEAEGFLKIGDKQIREAEMEGLSVQEITQEVEAVKPGMYSFGPSSIEGYAYNQNGLGEKIYQGSLLKAEAPMVKVEVLPFPEKKQPLSFVGVMGDLDMNLRLVTSSEMSLGDRIQLDMKIQSSGNLDELKFPKLDCQPSFSGFFSIDSVDLTHVEKGSRSFLINLRPQTSLLTEIPSIEIATFDPSTANYSIWQSPAIPIKILETIKEPAMVPEFQPMNHKEWAILEDRLKNRPSAPLLLDAPLYLKASELDVSCFKKPSVLYFVPLAIILLILQTLGHQKWVSYRLQHQQKSSLQWLNEGLREKDPAKASYLLQKALAEHATNPAAKKILEHLDAFQYGPERAHWDDIKNECKFFFHQDL